MIALIGMHSLIASAQTENYQREVNGNPVPGATSATFMATPQKEGNTIPAFTGSDQLQAAGKMLHKYKETKILGSLFEVSGAAIMTINLVEMNRTNLPKSNYTPFFVVGGGLTLAGYVINQFIAPGLIDKAGVEMRGNMLVVCIP